MRTLERLRTGTKWDGWSPSRRREYAPSKPEKGGTESKRDECSCQDGIFTMPTGTPRWWSLTGVYPPGSEKSGSFSGQTSLSAVATASRRAMMAQPVWRRAAHEGKQARGTRRLFSQFRFTTGALVLLAAARSRWGDLITVSCGEEIHGTLISTRNEVDGSRPQCLFNGNLSCLRDQNMIIHMMVTVLPYSDLIIFLLTASVRKANLVSDSGKPEA